MLKWYGNEKIHDKMNQYEGIMSEIIDIQCKILVDGAVVDLMSVQAPDPVMNSWDNV